MRWGETRRETDEEGIRGSTETIKDVMRDREIKTNREGK